MGEMLKWRGQEIPALLPGVEFNEDRHEYKLFGVIWPNITGFLPYNFYNVSDTGAKWGTSAHKHAFHFVKKTIDIKRVAKSMLPTLEGFAAGLKHFGISLDADVVAEYIVYSKRYHFIGRFDFLFDLGEFDLLFDFKTGAISEQGSRRTGLQVGGYAIAAIEQGLTTLRRLRLGELNVQPDGTWTPREWRGREVRELMHTFLAQVTVQNYYNKL